jgi:transcriptional regulator with GAF, ATPase, and Fis domain
MITRIGALIHTDRDAAKQEILRVLREARGDRAAAAHALGQSTPRSLYRWIERLGMWPEVDALIAEHGFPAIPGPPRSRDRIIAAMVRDRGNVQRASQALDMKPATLEKRIAELGIAQEIERLVSSPSEADTGSQHTTAPA